MSRKKYFNFIDETIQDTQKKFSGVIRRLISLAKGATATKQSNFIDVSIAEETARTLLGEAGYTDAVIGFLDNSYNSAVVESARFLIGEIGGTFRFSDESMAIMESIRETDLLQFNNISEDIVTRTSTGFSEWARGGVTRDDFLSGLKEQLDIADNRYLKTQVDTAFAAYNRTTSVKLAEDAGFKKFVYIGPNDSLTRPFCSKMIGQEKTIDEWNAFNNDPTRKGQPNPVSAFCGGHSCRHLLVAVD